MGKTNNSKSRIKDIQDIALSIIDQPMIDSITNAAAKPLRVSWQHQLMQKTNCTPFTARKHIAAALRIARSKKENTNE